MNPLWRLASLIMLAAFGAHAGTALAQSYPSKPIRIVWPYAPGGAGDILSRLISPKMADALKQPVLVENRPGAGGKIAEDAVAKAAPDGHTILMDCSCITINPALYRNLPFDVTKDFIPVSQITASIPLLVANPKLPAVSIRELIALAKSKPGRLNYGHAGAGTSLALVMELTKLTAGIDILGIQYKSDALVTSALLAGEVDVAVATFPPNLPHIKSGRLRALGVSSAKRSAVLPDVPTFAEAGVDVELVSWYGLFAPAKTPRGIIELIQRQAVNALSVPDVRDRILAMGQEPVGSTSEEFDARFKADLAKFAKIVKEARIPLQD